jgi:hypothetical protein
MGYASPALKCLMNCFANKQIAQFCVNDLSPVEWNDSAFNNLVLPGREKELAWAFVECKALASNQFDDFIQDKGKF